MSGAVDVPADADPAVCERCGAPFPTEQLLALHRGRAHDDLTESERQAYAASLDAEATALRRFQFLALGALVVLYFGFFFAYALVT